MEIFLAYPDEFYLPCFVAQEISAKSDEAFQKVIELINSGNIVVKEIQLSFLADSLNMRLGKGESEAIALGIELKTDYIILISLSFTSGHSFE
ncbi:hypothetical protein [Nodularia chucula]|uniref:hypothetical protein n=1 Tax=Nodularia chucula TaxID=3093667 RepID=UPI0039C5D329